MASLAKQIKQGKAYWYAVQCGRVDGQPRIVWQKYLGRVDEIVKAVEGGTAPQPECVLIRQFGGVAALLGVAEQLDVLPTIDRHVRKRQQALDRAAPCQGQGASIGQYMLLAAIAAIERDLVDRLMQTTQLDLRASLYDTTNFATFIHTLNERNTIAQRGHVKSKRHDLRIERLCGKTILFTDRDAWSNEEIVSAYRAQSGIEERFRDMNDWDFLRWTPMYHWTDQKIRVHAFYCVLALMLVGVLRQRLSQAGINLPTHALLDTLTKMLETVLVYPPTQPPAPPRLATTLSRFDAQQKAIYTALDLSRWRPAEG